MCENCGCADFIQQGLEATLGRAIAVIKELGVTAENVQRFEDGERICNFLIASKVASGEDAEVRQIAEWVMGLHRDTYAERSRAYARAAREVFANFPAKGDPREIITTWHQLEQLCRELGDETVSSIGEVAIRDAIRAVQRVHDDPKKRLTELAVRYHLEGV